MLFRSDKYKEIDKLIIYISIEASIQNKKVVFRDLITEKTQKKVLSELLKKNDNLKQRQNKYLNNEESKEDEEIEIIFALSMFREGSDFISLERSITIGNMGSVTRTMQSSVGRVARDYFKKNVAEVFFVMNNRTIHLSDQETVREIVNQNLHNLHCAMDMLFDLVPEITETVINNKKRQIIKTNTWVEEFPFNYKIVQDRIQKRVYNEIDPDLDNERKQNKMSQIITDEILKENLTDKKKITNLIISFKKQWYIKNIAMKTDGMVCMTLITENMIADEDIFSGINEYTSKVFGVSGFKSIQEKCGNIYNMDWDLKTIEELNKMFLNKKVV